jgi:hypothetical protein
MTTQLRELIDEANREAVERIINTHPMLVDMKPLADVVPAMHRHMVLHAGPPVKWNDMAECMKSSVVGVLLFEELAKSVDEAVELAGSGAIEFAPNNDHGGCGGMTGVLSASMPVYVVKDCTYGNTVYTFSAGRFVMGGYDDQTVDNLHWLRERFMPAMSTTLRKCGGVNLDEIRARAIHMGDEIHNRSDATALLLFKELAPAMVRGVSDTTLVREILDYLAGSVHRNFGTRFNMGACKVALVAAEDIEFSTVVTVMSRNGAEVGIKVSGLGKQWFTGPAGHIDGAYFAGFSEADACLDLGDSAITETAGWGAFACAASPAMVQAVGGSMQDALAHTLEMYDITVGESRKFTIPYLDYRGTPVGIDIRKVVETGTLPITDTAIAHKDFGVGIQIGVGFVRPPMQAFEKALRAYGDKYVD